MISVGVFVKPALQIITVESFPPEQKKSPPGEKVPLDVGPLTNCALFPYADRSYQFVPEPGYDRELAASSERTSPPPGTPPPDA